VAARPKAFKTAPELGEAQPQPASCLRGEVAATVSTQYWRGQSEETKSKGHDPRCRQWLSAFRIGVEMSLWCLRLVVQQGKGNPRHRIVSAPLLCASSLARVTASSPASEMYKSLVTDFQIPVMSRWWF